MKLIILKNKDKVMDFEPEWFVKIKFGEEWKDVGTGMTKTSPKGTNYIEQEIADDFLVDKLKEIDFVAKSPKTQEFLKEKDAEYNDIHYPKPLEVTNAEKAFLEKYN